MFHLNPRKLGSKQSNITRNRTGASATNAGTRFGCSSIMKSLTDQCLEINKISEHAHCLKGHRNEFFKDKKHQWCGLNDSTNAKGHAVPPRLNDRLSVSVHRPCQCLSWAKMLDKNLPDDKLWVNNIDHSLNWLCEFLSKNKISSARQPPRTNTRKANTA